jgi:hypothetical protein
MIRNDKVTQALTALNKILVMARHMAREKTEHAQIESLLDAAELLPMLFLRAEDKTELYRQILADVAAEFPMLGGLLNVFDQADEERNREESR